MQSVFKLFVLAGLWWSAHSFLVNVPYERGLRSSRHERGKEESPRLSLASENDELDTCEGENIFIEYCTGCRWLLRSAWLAQELLTTFENEIDSVTLIPSRPPAPGGVFRVSRNGGLVWDRKGEGRFPESKELKQRVRDLIAPQQSLGHSDTATRQEEAAQDCDDCAEDENQNSAVPSRGDSTTISLNGGVSPNIAISYCTGCRWLLRAAWIAQELLVTFDTELNSVTLIPCRPPLPGGTFLVVLDGKKLLWDRSAMKKFPELKELKQKIRDEIAPSLNLGHSDDDEHQQKQEEGLPMMETMDDDEAEEMRKYFGVM